ncbi:universal stress protein [Paracoccus seriniphilus]|uniref:Universal stress protein family protein n=1 Tax=Paracoccus seriniphilus TaxID=184748 RepID=A0A239PME9_9RHOB|nr:universal stress protein [Paracoccus seriniphilus]WCR15298.1 universal stress protein [Paracoccus seriniphilus]SNT68797.1 Universal stress protein family protein [Paracoccus seriniphilus]
MAYKTILTVLTAEDHISHLEAATVLAAREDAHLDVLCIGADHSNAGYYFPGAAPYVYQSAIDDATKRAKDLEEMVRNHMSGTSDIRWSVESAVAQTGSISSLVAMQARFSDLTVLGRPYGEGAGGDLEVVIEAALFQGGCPVLVVPETGLPAEPPRHIMIAWNQSAEAMTATRRALPLLKQAETVEVTLVDPSPSGPERSDPGGALTQMLSRHGVRAEIAVLARMEPAISDELIRRAAEIGADMIVMGAYGHSRFREAILGGATRNMLKKTALPVLMAH